MNTGRLRDMAAKMRRDAEGKLAPRETNTDRKLKMAREAERDGQQLTRAAVLLEAFCEHADAGTLPTALCDAKPTRDLFLRMAALVGTHVSNGSALI